MSNSFVHSSKSPKKSKAVNNRPIDELRATINRFSRDATDFETALTFFEKQTDTEEIRNQIISDVHAEKMSQSELEEALGIALSKYVKLKNENSILSQFSKLAKSFRAYVKIEIDTKPNSGRPQRAFKTAHEVFRDYLAAHGKAPSGTLLMRLTNRKLIGSWEQNEDDVKESRGISLTTAKNYRRSLLQAFSTKIS